MLPKLSRRRTLGLLAGAALLGSASPALAEWRRIDTPNFTVVGDVGAGTLRNVALKFEGFRETLTRVLTERATATAVPTIVIVFPSDRAFTPFKPLYQGKPLSGIAGLFVGRSDANYIAVVDQGQADGMRIVFHEYAHLVVSNVLRNVPPWLNEGLAEYYSTFELSGDGRQAVIGRFIASHLLELNEKSLLKVRELIAVDHQSPLYNERDRRSIFYAQSWALTHRILRGEPTRITELFAYLDGLTQGSTPLDAWQKAFGAADIDRELREYVRRQSFQSVRYRFSDKLASLDVQPVPLSAADAEGFLADFLYQQGRLDEALARAAAAEKLSPGNARGLTIRSLVEIAKGDRDSGVRQLETIATPDDWLIAYTAAVGLVEAVEARRETPTDQQTQAVRRLFESVRQRHGEIPNVNARLTMLELRSPTGPSKEGRSGIERARLMVPGREDYVFLHAQVLARLKEYLPARNVIGPLMSAAYPSHIRESARELMRYVLELEAADQRAASLAAASVGPAAAAEAAQAPDSDRPRGFQPLFRERKDGEDGFQGTLERIECAPGGAVTFHLRGEAGVERLSAPKMSDVEFITYRDDLSGSVTCGPVKQPLPVVVTWRNNGKAKAVVAIEFLPK